MTGHWNVLEIQKIKQNKKVELLGCDKGESVWEKQLQEEAYLILLPDMCWHNCLWVNPLLAKLVESKYSKGV